MSRRVKVVLGQRQADALLEALGRGLDEWDTELEENSTLGVTRADYRLAFEAFDKVNLARHEAQR